MNALIGKTLCHYAVSNLIGRGGMGEVYRATDTKLDRDVAINVLPEEFAKDVDRVARVDIQKALDAPSGLFGQPSEAMESRTLNEKYNETMPEISPDGGWMAYMSDESGQYEICVRPFPEINSGECQVSQKGGVGPLWSPDGRKLCCRSGDAVMAVPVETESTFKPGKAEIVFRGYPPASFVRDM